jgi:two-component system, NtrC family, sensor kinase
VNACHPWGIHALAGERYPFPPHASPCSVWMLGMKPSRTPPSRAPERVPPETAAPGGAASIGRERKSVLVVDDEPLILKVVAQILGIEHDVTCEPSSKAALERFRNGERFDVVLCDLMMPYLTGIDLYDALLEIDPRQARSVLFLTGGAFTPRAQAFLDRVQSATIEKPFNQATLNRRVREFFAS